MENWKSHVRAQLIQRDHYQKDPYYGVFRNLSNLQEQCEIRHQIWDDVQQTQSLEQDGIKYVDLYFCLRESEHLSEKLSQTVSDLTSVLYLKEAELQYWQSQVSRYRHEALTLARGSNTLKATLAQCEFTLERQSKEFAALRKEHAHLQEELVEAWKEKGQLLQRWMKEKMEEAARVNTNNDIQERWHRLARRLKKRHCREMGKCSEPTEINTLSDRREASISPIQNEQQHFLMNS